MTDDAQPPKMLSEHVHEFRVRYSETDAQGRVYHAHYISYFEVGRTELCRASGLDYKRMEEEGLFFVVTEVTCRYRLPASYDDLLRLHTKVVKTHGARIVHEYQLFKGDQLLVEGQSKIALIDRTGQVRRLPDWLLLEEGNC
jgi:acyl-CoA thioester hydrolase